MGENLERLQIPVLTPKQANELGSITLAFVGDAVYSLYVRANTSVFNTLKSGALNQLTANKVCAVHQAELTDKLLPHLTDEELAVFKRARNTKKPTKTKNSSVVQYNKSTGFEAVIGFLYLTDNRERLHFILNFEDTDNES